MIDYKRKPDKSIESRLGLEVLFINGNTLSEMIRRDVELKVIPRDEPTDKYVSALKIVYRNNIVRLLEQVGVETDAFEMHGVKMLRHKNGNGWIQDTVIAEEHTFVPESAVIFGNNDITDARIKEGALIGDPYEQITPDKRKLSGPLI